MPNVGSLFTVVDTTVVQYYVLLGLLPTPPWLSHKSLTSGSQLATRGYTIFKRHEKPIGGKNIFLTRSPGVFPVVMILRSHETHQVTLRPY